MATVSTDKPMADVVRVPHLLTYRVSTPIGTTLTLHCNDTETVQSVLDRLGIQEDVPGDLLRLSYLDRALSPTQAIGDYGLLENSILSLGLKRFASSATGAPPQLPLGGAGGNVAERTLVVKNPLNKTQESYVVPMNETVVGLKDRIALREGIKPENQRLVYAGKELQPPQTLKEMGVFDSPEPALFVIARNQ